MAVLRSAPQDQALRLFAAASVAFFNPAMPALGVRLGHLRQPQNTSTETTTLKPFHHKMVGSDVADFTPTPKDAEEFAEGGNNANLRIRAAAKVQAKGAIQQVTSKIGIYRKPHAMRHHVVDDNAATKLGSSAVIELGTLRLVKQLSKHAATAFGERWMPIQHSHMSVAAGHLDVPDPELFEAWDHHPFLAQDLREKMGAVWRDLFAGGGSDHADAARAEFLTRGRKLFGEYCLEADCGTSKKAVPGSIFTAAVKAAEALPPYKFHFTQANLLPNGMVILKSANEASDVYATEERGDKNFPWVKETLDKYYPVIACPAAAEKLAKAAVKAQPKKPALFQPDAALATELQGDRAKRIEGIYGDIQKNNGTVVKNQLTGITLNRVLAALSGMQVKAFAHGAAHTAGVLGPKPNESLAHFEEYVGSRKHARHISKFVALLQGWQREFVRAPASWKSGGQKSIPKPGTYLLDLPKVTERDLPLLAAVWAAKGKRGETSLPLEAWFYLENTLAKSEAVKMTYHNFKGHAHRAFICVQPHTIAVSGDAKKCGKWMRFDNLLSYTQDKTTPGVFKTANWVKMPKKPLLSAVKNM